MLLLRFSALLVAASTLLAGPERLPIELFARAPDTRNAQLSPDGKFLAFRRGYSGHEYLHIADIEGGKVARLDLGPAFALNNAQKDVDEYSWIGDHRLLISTSVWDEILYGVVAVDCDGQRRQSLGGYEDNRLGSLKLYAREVIHRFYDKDSTALVLDHHEDSPGARDRPDVLTVNTLAGTLSMSLKNPGEVSSWCTDANGVVRLGVLTRDDLSGAIYRDSENSPWRTILPLDRRSAQPNPVGFDAVNNRILVRALTEQKRWTIFPLDPATGVLGAPLLTDPEYDILPDHYIPEIDGNPLCEPIFSPKKDALLGVRYVTDAPRVKWFNREFAKMQSAIDHVAKDTVNLLVNLSLDGKRMLWFGYSDQNPGTYYLADTQRHSLTVLAQCAPWIKPQQMAQMLAVKYKARDGLLIHGFLTIPVGHQPKNLPLVVMPHGGPWARDVWGYDPLVQLLANRGYAVLQMNYRGSPGYGEELYANAKRQIGRQIQDDIEDATRWAIAAGVADSKRIAIFGASYGGYSALFALGQSPALYRCAISFGGVTDWPALYRNSDVADYKTASEYWRKQIGDPKDDADMLRAISPISFPEKITAPVLIIQGKEDRRVPPDQAKRMLAALEKAGQHPESLFVSGVGHSFGGERSRFEIYTKITGFLEKHLGPGVN